MRETFACHQRGLSIEDIARERRCTMGTIEGHLIECVRAGYAVDIAQFVSHAQRLVIERAIAEHGAGRLKPLHDSLPNTITYNMIRFIVAERRLLEKSRADASKAHGQSNSLI